MAVSYRNIAYAVTDSNLVKILTPRGEWPRQLYILSSPQAENPYIIATGFDIPPFGAKHIAQLDLNELGCSAKEFYLLSDSSNEVWIQDHQAKPFEEPAEPALEPTQEDLVDCPETFEIGEVPAISQLLMVYDLKRKMLSLVPAESFNGKRNPRPYKGAFTEMPTAKKYVQTFAPAYNWPLDLYTSDWAKPEDRYTVVPHTEEIPQDVAAAGWRRIACFTLRYRGASLSSLYGLAAVSQTLWIGPVEEMDGQDQIGSNEGLGPTLLEDMVNMSSPSTGASFQIRYGMLTAHMFRCRRHALQILRPLPTRHQRRSCTTIHKRSSSNGSCRRTLKASAASPHALQPKLTAWQMRHMRKSMSRATLGP